MGSLFSSPAASERGSFPLEYMPKEMLAKLDDDPAGFQDFVNRANIARRKLTQQYVPHHHFSALASYGVFGCTEFSLVLENLEFGLQFSCLDV